MMLKDFEQEEKKKKRIAFFLIIAVGITGIFTHVSGVFKKKQPIELGKTVTEDQMYRVWDSPIKRSMDKRIEELKKLEEERLTLQASKETTLEIGDFDLTDLDAELTGETTNKVTIIISSDSNKGIINQETINETDTEIIEEPIIVEDPIIEPEVTPQIIPPVIKPVVPPINQGGSDNDKNDSGSKEPDPDPVDPDPDPVEPDPDPVEPDPDPVEPDPDPVEPDPKPKDPKEDNTVVEKTDDKDQSSVREEEVKEDPFKDFNPSGSSSDGSADSSNDDTASESNESTESYSESRGSGSSEESNNESHELAAISRTTQIKYYKDLKNNFLPQNSNYLAVNYNYLDLGDTGYVLKINNRYY